MSAFARIGAPRIGTCREPRSTRSFPAMRLRLTARIDRLSIGERQMVEIARAAATPGVRLIVLDEPTSSLDLERSQQLRDYVRARAGQGLAFIFISHKLQEIIDVASRVVVLRNGRVAWKGAVSESSVDGLVELMGGDASAVHHRIDRVRGGEDEAVRIGGRFVADGRSISLHRGESCRSGGPRGSRAKGSVAGHLRGEGAARGQASRVSPRQASFPATGRRRAFFRSGTCSRI